MHNQDPSDYWTNLALTDTLARQIPPRIDEALRHATAAVALRPNDSMSHAALVRSIPLRELALDDPLRQLAYDHARRALELDPENRVIHRIALEFMETGWWLYVEKDYERSIAAYQTALHLKPHYVRARFYMAHALRAIGRLDESVAEYKKGIAIKPSQAAYKGLVKSLLQQEKFEEAREVANELIKSSPDRYYSYLALGRVFQAQGMYDKQIELCRKATQIAPNESLPFSTLGVAYWNRGLNELAAPNFERALQLDPNDLIANCNSQAKLFNGPGTVGLIAAALRRTSSAASCLLC